MDKGFAVPERWQLPHQQSRAAALPVLALASSSFQGLPGKDALGWGHHCGGSLPCLALHILLSLGNR